MQADVRPFIYPLQTPEHRYIYDVNTNSLIRTDPGTWEYLQDPSEEKKTQRVAENVSRMKKDGFLGPNPIRELEHHCTPLLPNILERSIAGITLQVTQQCNLRCGYCVYSSKYDNRVHSSKKMAFDMAKKCIDFLMAKSVDLPSVDIAFYGGEPLLAFDLIKKVVAYVHEKFDGKDARFHMTTNGTVFNDENLKFLSRHDFGVMISLDGPREIHDSNRVFAASGEGTFDVIMANLTRIKKDFPKLYKRFTFNAVFDPSLNANCGNQFFIDCVDLEDAQVSTTIITQDYLKDQDAIPDTYFVLEEIETFKMLMYKTGRLEDQHVTKVCKNKFSYIKTFMHDLRHKSAGLPAKCHPSGPCIPGAKKLFVTVDGKLLPCEKLNEQSEVACIGHIDDGFDLDKVEKLLNVARLTEDKCKSCWAFRLCSQCCITADDDKELSAKKKFSYCPGTRSGAADLLKNYCVLVENGCDFESESIPLYIY